MFNFLKSGEIMEQNPNIENAINRIASDLQEHDDNLDSANSTEQNKPITEVPVVESEQTGKPEEETKPVTELEQAQIDKETKSKELEELKSKLLDVKDFEIIKEIILKTVELENEIKSFDVKITSLQKVKLLRDDLKNLDSFKELNNWLVANIGDSHSIEIVYNKATQTSTVFIDSGVHTNKRTRKGAKRGEGLKTQLKVSFAKVSGAYFKFSYKGENYLLETKKDVKDVLNLTDYFTRFDYYQKALDYVRDQVGSIYYADANGKVISELK